MLCILLELGQLYASSRGFPPPPESGRGYKLGGAYESHSQQRQIDDLKQQGRLHETTESDSSIRIGTETDEILNRIIDSKARHKASAQETARERKSREKAEEALKAETYRKAAEAKAKEARRIKEAKKAAEEENLNRLKTGVGIAAAVGSAYLLYKSLA